MESVAARDRTGYVRMTHLDGLGSRGGSGSGSLLLLARLLVGVDLGGGSGSSSGGGGCFGVFLAAHCDDVDVGWGRCER